MDREGGFDCMWTSAFVIWLQSSDCCI